MGGVAFTEGGARRNALLAALPDSAWQRLAPALHPLFVVRDQALFEPGAPLEHLYFPATAIVSVLYPLAGGASDEVAVVGAEGAVGVALIMGGGTTPSRAVVQRPGWVYRLRRRRLDEELARGEALQHLLLAYVQTRLTQLGQLAVCNRHDSIDQQLCRWLLLWLERQASDVLSITHERIASRLGVRREGVTEAAGKLRRAGLIRSGCGRITVLDRAGLAARSCECYRAPRHEPKCWPAETEWPSARTPDLSAVMPRRYRAGPRVEVRDVGAGADISRTDRAACALPQ